LSAKNRCELLTVAGKIATIWQDGNQWRWTVGGSEGCLCESFDEAVLQAEEASQDVEVQE